MSRSPLHQRLISIVEPVCLAAGYELIDLRYVLEQGGWTLRIAIDLPIDDRTDPGEVPEDRVDLEDCETMSRELSAVLDVEDPIPQAFSLEVSSPGIDRPLRTAPHYEHFVGSEAKIQLAMPLALDAGERRNFKGILKGVEEGKIVIDCDGTTFRIPIDDVEQAKLVPDWEAVMKGKSGVGAPLAKPIKPGHRPSQKAKPAKRHAAARQEPEGSGQGDPRGGANGPASPGQGGREAPSSIDNKEQG
jgi:ribosome maturation factor RimP